MNLKMIADKAGVLLKHAGPDILTGGGIVLGIAALIVACSDMKKAEKVHEEVQEELDEIQSEMQDAPRAERVKTYVKFGLKTAWRYLKVFWLPLLLEILSIIAIWYSHGLMVKRNADLASAAVILTQQMDNYRGRVRDKVGEEAENDLFYGIENRKIGEVIEDKGDGSKPKKHNIYEKVFTDGAGGPFDRVYDTRIPGFPHTPGQAMINLGHVRRALEDKMISRATDCSLGYLLINEVYEALNFDSIEDGFFWGWTFDKLDPKAQDIVDFGINDFSNDCVHDFVTGQEPGIPLHFNCHPINLKNLGLLKL